LSAGFVENLSFFTPFSSNIITVRSDVHIANFLPLGAQQMAVTLVIPSLGWLIDVRYFNIALK
jgi:hypothetical protein